MKDHQEIIIEWNKMFCSVVLTDTDTNTFMADYCERSILAAKEAYYEGSPIMLDTSYDWFEDRLRRLRPDSKIMEKVGWTN